MAEVFSYNVIEFSPYLYCEGIRFNPTAYYTYPVLVMQFYGRYLEEKEANDHMQKCQHPLGMGSLERIHGSQISSTSWEHIYYPTKSRLDGVHCWIAGSIVSKEYIEIDLGNVYNVNGLVTQSCKADNKYSYEFELEHSLHRMYGWEAYVKPTNYQVETSSFY